MSVNVQELTSLTTRLESIAAHPEEVLDLQNEALRQRLREVGRKLSYAMENEHDAVHRLATSPLEPVTARIGVEKGIFDALSSATGTLTNEELATKTKIDPVLMRRLLRIYQASHMVAQLGPDAYSANNFTKSMSTAVGLSGVEFFFESVFPAYNALPQFLRETGYKNPTDPNHLAFHMGHKTNLNFFPWLQAHPRQMKLFNQALSTLHDGTPEWFDTLDFRKEFLRDHEPDDSTPLFVDMGGAMGHQCISFKKRYPDLKGRVIVQDQPRVIKQIQENPLPGFVNIEAMEHDIFARQPIEEARAYYVRMIFHDWPDDKAAVILKHLKDAMTKNSYLLIDDRVLSEQGAPWGAAYPDATMMVLQGAQERTKLEWEGLLERNGFKIQKIWEYVPQSQESLIAAVLA